MATTIILSKRQNDIRAHISGKPDHCGLGSSTREAIGHLVQSHPEVFEVAIVWNPDAESQESFNKTKS